MESARAAVLGEVDARTEADEHEAIKYATALRLCASSLQSSMPALMLSRDTIPLVKHKLRRHPPLSSFATTGG